jgi:hypothetical protein
MFKPSGATLALITTSEDLWCLRRLMNPLSARERHAKRHCALASKAPLSFVMPGYHMLQSNKGCAINLRAGHRRSAVRRESYEWDVAGSIDELLGRPLRPG